MKLILKNVNQLIQINHLLFHTKLPFVQSWDHLIRLHKIFGLNIMQPNARRSFVCVVIGSSEALGLTA